jgi:2-keto-4-pentenoate hydratase/2-oxohepta-3-ene-1,7-dioic acid hydratase in catechol pathway
MRLLRAGEAGAERPGLLLDDGRRVDVQAGLRELGHADYDEAFLGSDGLADLAAWAADHATDAPVVGADVRLGPPVARPGKIVCVGLNFRDHAAETGQAPPEEPVLFLKATSALVGPDDDLVLPRGSEKTDWEVELAVVIGRRASYVAVEDALDHVAGYVLHNDYSEREYQLERGGQWDKGKGCDTFAPLGPWLVTPDELGGAPSELGMWLEVNGQRRQSSSTDQMIFDVPTLVSYISEFMTLLPGDVISTGTPGGVGLSLQPAAYLRAGDVVTLGIDGLGTQTQHVR